MNEKNLKTKELISQLATSDGHTEEAAFKELSEKIDDVKNNVYYAAVREEDARTLAYLLELLGESKDEKYVRYIGTQLQSVHAVVRFSAHAALRKMNTPQSRALHLKCNLHELMPKIFDNKNNES